MSEAKRVIFEGEKPKGFRISFERKDGKFLTSDYFPERDEPLILHEEEAWDLAIKFAAATFGKCVNIHVVDDGFIPVSKSRAIENR